MAEEGEGIDIEAPFLNETFNFFTRLGYPIEVKNAIIEAIDTSRFSLAYKKCLKNTVNVIFDKVVQYSHQKDILMPALKIRVMLLKCRIAANSRDIRRVAGVTCIEDSIILAAEMILTRTIGEDRERKLQRYPGYVEQRAVNTEIPPMELPELGEKREKRRFWIFR
ncbi:hypothetical protein DRO54_03665 [Candidatus Bathyarchaeota archaeon]|nr:MAG: hypothetical protein DRO54_03665 [Candidatus Bathyarchaeota archaeon]